MQLYKYRIDIQSYENVICTLKQYVKWHLSQSLKSYLCIRQLKDMTSI